MNLNNKEKDWASPTLKEAPFWREGMTPEEYDEENAYLDLNFQKLLDGTYTPLWKQKIS